MMTLPAGWENYIDGSFQTAIMIRVTTIDGTVLRFSTVETDGILSWTGDRYEEGLLAKGGLGKLAYSVNVDQGGNIARVGEFRFVLLNQDNYWDILNGYDLLNSEVVVKRFILEVEPTEFDDGLTRFTGRISARTYDRNNIYITCDHDETEHRTLPKKTIDNEIFPDFDIPDNSNGKRIPMLFGHMEKAEAFFCNNYKEILYGPGVASETGAWIRDDEALWVTDEWVDKDLEIIGGVGKGQIYAIESNTDIRVYVYDEIQTEPNEDATVYQISDSQFDMVLSDKKIFGFFDDNDSVVNGELGSNQECYFWDSSAKIYVPMNQRVLTYHNNLSPFTSLAGLRFLAGVVKNNEITFYYPAPFSHIENLYSDGDNILVTDIGDSYHKYYYDRAFTNPDNAKDWDLATAANCSCRNEHPSGSYWNYFGGALKCYLTTNMNDLIGSWNKIYVYEYNKTSISGPNYIESYHWLYSKAGARLDDWGAPHRLVIVFNSYMHNLPSLASPDTSLSSNIALIDLTDFITQGDWGSLNYNFWLKIYPLAFKTLSVAETEDYTTAMEELGFVFAKTIPLNEQSRFFFNAKGRMFTGGWYARKTPTDLVEGPSEVVECILRDDLGITNVNDLDMSNFDYITSLERVGWKMAFQQIDKIESLDLIKNICQETGMIYHKTPTGKHSLKVIDPSTTTKRTITTSDILKKSENESSFEVKFSPSKYIYNEYFVHYKKDPATGDYNGFKYVKNSHLTYDSSYTNLSTQATAYHALCAESYGKYGRVLPKHYYLDYIRDDSTAEKFLKKMCVFHYLERAEPEFDTQLQMMALELGDKVQMGADILEGSYFITEYSEDMNADQMHFKLRDF